MAIDFQNEAINKEPVILDQTKRASRSFIQKECKINQQITKQLINSVRNKIYFNSIAKK